MEKLITITDAASQLGVTKKTLQDWDRDRKMVALRTAGGHRRYRQPDIEKLQGIEREALDRNQVVVSDFSETPLDNEQIGVYIVCMKRVNFHLTDRQIKALQQESKRTGLSVAELIRRAVDALLEKIGDRHV